MECDIAQWLGLLFELGDLCVHNEEVNGLSWIILNQCRQSRHKPACCLNHKESRSSKKQTKNIVNMEHTTVENCNLKLSLK